MAFFSDILKKIKKPVDALKDFLTPKERTSLQEKEKPSPVLRMETKSPAFEYKPPSFEGLKSFASSFIPPKEAFERKEFVPRETPEERAARLEKARETTKKIADFGKAVLRAGPRAAASVTLEAQGRRTMIPETRAEKFLFGQEPLESLTERVERFPERAKEFGIQEPTAKKIAPFAVLGLTALDILPPLPGKSGLKAVAKKALTTKTAKEFAKAITKKESDQILKAGFKSVDDFFRVAKSPAAKTSTKIVDELKTAASVKSETSGIPKELESFVPQVGKHKDVNSFIREISGDTYAPEFRNPIADFWRKKYVQPLSKGSKATFTTDVVAFERNLDDVLQSKYGKDQLANMSVRQKSEIVNGKKWTNLYADMLDNNLFKFQQDFFKAAKSATPAQVKPTDALREAVNKTVHAKKLESGIDEAYRALEKTGKDEVYNLGKVGDYIADPKVREQYKDVLDTPLYIKKQMHMGKAHGSLSVDPKGNPAIVLSDGLTKDMIDRTLVEELTHASQFKKGVRPTKGVPYKEIPEEVRAKKAAKHFAPKTTLEDVIEASTPKVHKELGALAQEAKKLGNADNFLPKGIKSSEIDEMWAFGSSIRSDKYRDVDVAIFLDKSHPIFKKYKTDILPSQFKKGKIEYHVYSKENKDIFFSEFARFNKDTGGKIRGNIPIARKFKLEDLYPAKAGVFTKSTKEVIKPKSVVNELLEDAKLHRAKAKQFSNNDLEKEFVARQLGVAEGIEKAIDNIKSAKPTDELKKILYHGTDFENVSKIQKGGFKTGGFLAHGYPQGVYFTTTKKEAQNYGKVIQSTTKLKLSEFFDVSKHKELNNLQGQKYIQKLNQIIREAAESKGVAVPEATAKQTKQYTELVGKQLKDPLDISDIKTATLQKLGYKGFIAAEKGIGKEIVIFDPKDVVVGGKPSEVLKAELYHGTSQKGAQAIEREGFKWHGEFEGYTTTEQNWVSLTDDLKSAQAYATDAAEAVKEIGAGQVVKIDKTKLKLFDAEKHPRNAIIPPSDFIKDLKAKGFDGAILRGENEVMVWSREKLNQLVQQTKGLTRGFRKELDKTFENIPDFVKKRYPNAEAGRRMLEEGYERGLALSKQAGDIKPNTPVTSYHGTTRTSAEAIRKSGFKVPEAETFAESGGRKYGEGVYLQPAKEDAITSSLFYGKRADPKGMGADLAVLETEFIPKKPFVISSPQKFMPFGSNEWGGFIHKILKEPTINDSITAYLKNRPARLKVDAALRKAGFDSVILKADGKADLVVALNPSDVKITNIYKDADGSLETFRKGYQKAFRDSAGKPASAIEELKTATKTDIPEIKGATAIDLSKQAKVAQPSKVQEIIGEYQKRINTAPAKKAATPIRKTLDETYTAIIDRFHPITKLARKASELRPGENPELLARRYLGVQGIAESKLFWNTTRLTAEGNLEVTGPGLSKILRPAKDNIDDLRTLMVAERDIELSKRTLESGKKVVGTTPTKSKEVLNALKQKHGAQGFEQLSKTALGVREWSRKALLDPLLEVGAISKEQYDTIAKSNKFYVPFQRVIEELETHGFVPKKANIFSPKSVPVKKLKGSTKDIIDPFESMITNAYKVTDFVERARVGRSIANLRNTSPELAEMIKLIKPKLVPVAKQGEELIFRPSFFTPDKNTMMVFENGKRKFYQVPEDVFKAVSGMMESDVGAIMKVLAFPARTLRAGATLTPEFMGRNPLRDQLTAFVFSKYGYVPGVDLAKGIFNTVGKTDLHGRWLAGGGAHSMLVSLDRVTSQATLAKVLGSKDIKGMVKNPIEALRMLSEFGEKGTRVGAFGRAVKKGVSDLEAAFESRDITLDFARRGSQTRAVNMLVAFWNAQVQGLNKMVRSFRERPMQTTFKAASGVTLPSVLLYLNNRNDPRYQELPQWQKDLFWIIPIGDDGPIIRIPKPFEIGVIFGTVPEHILTWIDKNDPEALTSAAKTLMEASAPGYIPTGLQPIIENIANYSFFRQRPIVSEGKQALPKELQADRYTSETAKEVGKLIKQSPAKIENLFVSYTGGLGKYALDASDKLLKTLGVVSPPPEPAKTLSDRPFLRAFVAREPIGSGSESVNKFYKLYDEANATKAAVKGLAEEGKEQEAINYLRSRPAGFYTKGLNKVARTFSDLRKKRDAVLDSRDLNPEQKKRAIDALDKIMTEIARQTVELVETSNEKFRQ